MDRQAEDGPQQRREVEELGHGWQVWCSVGRVCDCGDNAAGRVEVLFRYTVHVIGVDSLELAHVTGAAESSETFRKFEFEKEQ